MISLPFDLVQSTESLNALVEVGQQQKQQHSTDQEQCYANTIRSLDLAIGYWQHVRERILTQIFE
jgi:hypothetical protein